MHIMPVVFVLSRASHRASSEALVALSPRIHAHLCIYVCMLMTRYLRGTANFCVHVQLFWRKQYPIRVIRSFVCSFEQELASRTMTQILRWAERGQLETSQHREPPLPPLSKLRIVRIAITRDASPTPGITLISPPPPT